jgi:hypothetical protein
LYDSGAIQALYGKQRLAAGVRVNRNWLIVFISRLHVRQNVRFRAAKCEKARRDKIR